MRRLGLLLLFLGCAVKNDARYCDPATPCRDPAFPICNMLARECQNSGGFFDLSGPEDDLSMAPEEDLASGDLAGADLTPTGDLASEDLTTPEDLSQPDLTPVQDLKKECITSTTCVAEDKPICDATQFVCRACTGNGDDTACALHGAGLRCRTAGGKLQGYCVQCNTNADCSAATPVCNSDGTCRKCRRMDECSTGVCDLRAVASNGTCVAANDMVFVDRDATCAGADGSAGKPYCQLPTTNGSLNGKAFVKVAARSTHYNGISLGGGNFTAYFVGGAFGAQPIIDANASGHSVNLDSNDNNRTINVTFDGFSLLGAAGGSAVVCDITGTNPNATLVIRNSVITGGDRAVNILHCNGTISETGMYGGIMEGIRLNNGSTWDLHNCFIALSGGPGVIIDAGSGTGSFKFNTVTQNHSGDNAGGVICSKATTLESSIIYNNAKTAGAAGTQFAGSCTISNVVTGIDGIGNTGKLLGNPVFRNPSASAATIDLRLKVDTAPDTATNQGCCIDKVTAGTNTIDIESEVRPKGANADVGGDEAL